MTEVAADTDRTQAHRLPNTQMRMADLPRTALSEEKGEGGQAL